MRGPLSKETLARRRTDERRMKALGFIPLDEAARIARRSRRTVNAWAADELVTSMRSIGRTYVRATDVKQVLERLGEEAA